MADARHVCLPFCLFLFAVWSDESRADRTTIDIGPTRTLAAAAAAHVPAAAATKESESPSPNPSFAELRSPAPKSRSIMQMLEGRESDLAICLAIALAAFIMGWLCGGTYHLRRHRARSRRLRF
jgi:hypothetical protein